MEEDIQDFSARRYRYIEFCKKKPMLLQLGFTSEEIQALDFILCYETSVSINSLMTYGLDYKQARKIKYMYDLANGRTDICDFDSLSRHLKRLFGDRYNLCIQDLPKSNINTINRKAFIANIKDYTFSMYNSEKYELEDRLYDVDKISNDSITIRTKRKPVLKYGEPKEVEGVAKINSIDTDKGTVLINFNKIYCRLSNRYLIVASFTRPTQHLGMTKILSLNGDKVYVYAKLFSATNEHIPMYATQIVYGYGYFKKDIKNMVMKISHKIYSAVNGVFIEYDSPNVIFHNIYNGGICNSSKEEQENIKGIED